MRLTNKNGWRSPLDSDMINVIYKRLAAYEDAEEQERMVEVRHGRWLVGGMFDDFGICSSCGVKYPMFAATEFNYCPSCGAKMDGGKDE